jgi:RNA polymerase sigma factor for flagellar operon FliA
MENCVKLSDYIPKKDISREVFKDFISQYLPLIRYIAARLAMRLPANIIADDLISAGVLGLMDAAEKFDPSKNIKFKTYAEFRIRGSMLDELRSMDWVPRSIRKKMTDLERVLIKLEKEKGRPVEDEEMAVELGITLEEYHQLLEETKGVSFLDIEMFRRRMPDNQEDDLFDLIADCEKNDPYAVLNLSEIKKIVMHAIDNLPAKEREVVTLYYYEELTMKEIGEIIGYTESRISQLHSKAILRIRARLSRLNASIGEIVI